MPKVILGMTMSLDGYVNDENGSVGKLFSDFDTLQNSEEMQKSIQETGAVIMGNNTFKMAEDPELYAENYEYQTPIFVLCGTLPEKKPKESDKLTFTFITEGVEEAITRAKMAEGGKDVTIIGGASTARQCLMAGLVDELQIDIMPVILGEGLKLFESMENTPIELEKIRVNEFGDRTSLVYGVNKQYKKEVYYDRLR